MANKSNDWQPLDVMPLADLAAARLQAHYAAQWLAKAARAFVPSKPDDSHTSLSWRRASGTLVTQPFGDHLQLGLNIAGLELQVLSGVAGVEQERFALNGASDTQVRYWLGGLIARGGLDAAGLDASPPWDMPSHPIAQGVAYDGEGSSAALESLWGWYANADLVLCDLIERNAAIKPGPSPVRCWPHHFDIATLISLSDGDPEHAKSVGVGLSPGDDTYNEPYYYVSPWPYPQAGNLPDLPSGAHWHTAGFTAAIASASVIWQARDTKAAIHNFVHGATDAAIGLMI